MSLPKWVNKCSSIIAILFFITGIILGIFLEHYAFPELKTLWKIIKTYWVNFTLAAAAVFSALYAHRSNQRSEQLFAGQRRPIIQVRPIAIKDYPEFPAVETILSIVNYSGFIARNISFDLKYDDYDWCYEWIRADQDKKQAISNVSGKTYTISAGTIEELHPEKSHQASIRGTLDLNEVCKNKKINVYVKARWENESNFIFEKIWQYSLICTTTGEGRSIDFTLRNADINMLNPITLQRQ